MELKSPFPWFGNKRKVTQAVWDRFGNPQAYIEPFFGSGAMVLQRPHPLIAIGSEIVNDKDRFVANAWRAMRLAPDETARWADVMVNETDLRAVHRAINNDKEFADRMDNDPDYFDPKVAGRWIWGACSSIGTQFTNCKSNNSIPQLTSLGIHSQMNVQELFKLISARFRKVKICNGDWSRVLCNVAYGQADCGIFFDPPYEAGDHNESLYTHSTGCSKEVEEWCKANGDNPKFKIALCGYDTEHQMPESWECYKWKSAGAMIGNDENLNGERERIWFSPHCLKPAQGEWKFGDATPSTTLISLPPTQKPSPAAPVAPTCAEPTPEPATVAEQRPATPAATLSPVPATTAKPKRTKEEETEYWRQYWFDRGLHRDPNKLPPQPLGERP